MTAEKTKEEILAEIFQPSPQDCQTLKYKGKLSRITRQHLKDGFVCVDNMHSILKTSLRLAKIGDKIILSADLSEPHCAAITTITGFKGNGIINS